MYASGANVSGLVCIFVTMTTAKAVKSIQHLEILANVAHIPQSLSIPTTTHTQVNNMIFSRLGQRSRYHHSTHGHRRGRLKRNPHCLQETLTRLTIVSRLSNPHLRNKFGINSRHGRMQGHFVQQAIDSSWEKDQGHAPAGLDFKVEGRKGRRPTLLNVVEVDQNGHDSLASIGGKSSSIFVAEVKGIKMLCKRKER
jgi:hypothetical protein